MSVRLLIWSFALCGCLDDGVVEYSVGSLLVCAFARLVVCCVCVLVLFIACLIGCLIGGLVGCFIVCLIE